MYRTVCDQRRIGLFFRKIRNNKGTVFFLTRRSDRDLDPVQLFRIRILPGLKVDPPASTPLLYGTVHCCSLCVVLLKTARIFFLSV
jgi:hypothetical protein